MNSTINITKAQLHNHTSYLRESIDYIDEKLAKNSPNDLRIIKDHLYIKNNIELHPSLTFNFSNQEISQAIALRIPAEGNLANNIFLITPFLSIKIAAITNPSFNKSSITTTLENLNLEESGDFFFARNDYLSKPITSPATFKNIENKTNSLDEQLIALLPQILSAAKHQDDSYLPESWTLNLPEEIITKEPEAQVNHHEEIFHSWGITIINSALLIAGIKGYVYLAEPHHFNHASYTYYNDPSI